jgi:hypothetical protein
MPRDYGSGSGNGASEKAGAVDSSACGRRFELY